MNTREVFKSQATPHLIKIVVTYFQNNPREMNHKSEW